MSTNNNSENAKEYLTSKTKDLPRWYTQVIKLSKLADYGPVKGTMVIRPYGYAIWDRVQDFFNELIEKFGVENAYFPLFIPMKLLQREKEHIKGFSPELAIVTHGGGKKLEEPLAIRPTSETIMYEMYAKWISSWRDLPLKINQWNNVVRWEKRTYFFLRTLEFLWQEAHTTHRNYEEAEKMALEALHTYKTLYKDYFALPCLIGIKSEAEKFAGADHTYSVELLMSNGKVLQGATSHHLGKNFSKAFNINFQDEDGKTKNVFQTSWGLSTRSLGAMIIVHGDNNGLVLPPKLAPIKVGIIPIYGNNDKNIDEYCSRLKKKLGNSKSEFSGKIEIFSDKEKSYGWKMNETDIMGIPIRLSVGNKEIKANTVSLSCRLPDIPNELVPYETITKKVEELSREIHKKMYITARNNLLKNIREVNSYKEFKTLMKNERGFIKALWCEDAKCEEKIKEETKATTRLKKIDEKVRSGKCVRCDKPAKYYWYFGQAY